MAEYRLADADVTALMNELKHKNHQDLEKCGVRIVCMFAHAPRDENTGEPKGPALKKDGWPAAALCRINSQKLRVQGCADAVIEIDGDTWPDRPPAEQEALIDHELQHVKLKLDMNDNVRLDGCNRPKLRLQPHDWQLGGFTEIAARHGTAAIEVQSAQAAYMAVRQALPMLKEVEA